jgi:hypothetical protein
MDLTEALAWLSGERSMTNIIPQHPIETWTARIDYADANATKQAYWIAKAYADGLLPRPVTDQPSADKEGET